MIGPKVDLAYAYDHIGAGADALAAVAEGRHAFAGVLQAAKRPMVIVGAGAAARADGQAVLVKFSPPRGTPFAERWHDLLHAEALALQVLRDHGATVAASQDRKSTRLNSSHRT